MSSATRVMLGGAVWASALVVASVGLYLTTALCATGSTSRESLLQRVVEIQRADYEGDRPSLRRLHQELEPFASDPDLAARVSYWRGFALWRRALNGFNESADPGDLESDLLRAVVDFRRAVVWDTTFVDAKVGAGSCLLNLLYLSQNDSLRAGALLAEALPFFRQATALDPENPRLLWVQGSSRWYMAPAQGGGQDRALEMYERGLRSARDRAQATGDPLVPSWGEPELLMNLAWSNLNRTTPNLVAAEAYARSALALVPYWHYVKDILLPQIESAKAKRE